MKKSLSAILVIFLSMIGMKAFASTLEIKSSKISMESQDSINPGGNGVVKNGVMKDK